MPTTRLFITASLGLLAVASLPVEAATVSACGPNVCYEYDNAQTAVALTGTPTLVGDSMMFLPVSFAASSSGGAGWTTTGGPTGNFIFSRVYTVNALNEIATFNVHEEYDYNIIDSFCTPSPPTQPATDCAQVRASLYVQARSLVMAGDGTSVSPADFIAFGDSSGNQISTLDALLNPAAVFTAAANNMQVGIQNTLRAFTGAAGENAFIQKKFTLTATTLNPVVPIPGAVWLMVSGLAVLGGLRRRFS